jgi:hypothetical protein
MKNIHVLPTDKPSRLYYNGTSYKDPNSTMAMDWYISSAGYQPQNIYITSDEVIKEGDWYYLPRTNDVYKSKEDPTDLNLERRLGVGKIILTTDQDLIKDGIQDIDDEFLEWFVNNPNCEWVEVIPLRKSSGYYDEKDNWHWDFLAYKIIIPKEYEKQDTLEEVPNKLDSVLAKITHQNDLGLSQWYEVVYYDNKWCSYSGSKTFEDGEKVVEWKYCKELL